MTVRGIACSDPYEILTDYDLDRIHEASLEVLERTGLRFQSEEALKILDSAGCHVDHQDKMVRFPRHIVEEALRKCPSSFILKGRTPEYDVQFSTNTVLYGNGAGIEVIDRTSGERRHATTQDVAEFVTFIDALDSMNFMFCMIGYVPDKPTLLNWEYLVIETLKYGKKPYLGGGSFGPWDPKWLVEIVEAAGREIVGWGTAGSPLDYSVNVLKAMKLYAERGWPVGVYCGISTGATGPTTFAGGLVQQNAEILAGIVYVQAINPGNPVVFGTFMLPMDMRVAAIAAAGIETTITYAATAQIARRYKIPSWVFAPMTDSKVPDQQAGYEKGMQWLMCSLTGINAIAGGGQLENEELLSYEQFIIDDEMIGMAKHFLRGIRVTDETLAVELINEVGPIPGHFLNRVFTKEWWKKEQYLAKVSDRKPYKAWVEAGSKDVFARANEQVAAIFEKLEFDPLPDDVCREMEKILKAAEKYETEHSGA